MKLTKVQKTTRCIVYSMKNLLVLSLITGLLPVFILGQTYQILGL